MSARRRLVVALAAAALPAGAAPALGGPLIALDPGHGGADTGAIGVLPPGTQTGLPPRTNARGQTLIYEKDVNLDVALRLQQLLEAQGDTVLMTRTTDAGAGDRPFPGTLVDLRRRVDMANAAGAQIFVSLHENSLNATASGTETYRFYVSRPESVTLAQDIQQGLVARLGLPDRGVKEAGFYVLKHTVMPSVLVEGAFVSNPQEALMLARPDVREAIAEGVAAGVAQYEAGAVTQPTVYGQPVRQRAVQPIRYWVTAGIFRTKREANLARRRLLRLRVDAVVRARYVKRAHRRLYLVVTGQFISLRHAKTERARLRRLHLPGRITGAPKPKAVATAWRPPPS